MFKRNQHPHQYIESWRDEKQLVKQRYILAAYCYVITIIGLAAYNLVSN